MMMILFDLKDRASVDVKTTKKGNDDISLAMQCSPYARNPHGEYLQQTNPRRALVQTIIVPLLCSSTLIFGNPSLCHATPSLVLTEGTEKNVPYIVSSPSANAARLLLDTPSAKAPNGDAALQELGKQIALQDRRLEQCQEGGKEWEQCFFYGTTPNPQEGPKVPFLPASTKSKIPTW